MREFTPPETEERAVPARVEPSEIGFINALVEGHDGIATMRTIDRRLGLVVFWVPAGQGDDFDEMFEAFQREVSIIRVDANDPILSDYTLEEWRG